MKKIVFTLLLALGITVSQAQTHTGNLTLSSQTEIDGFNFIEVIGNITINDAINGNITNLDGLISLTDIGGNLIIQANPSLMSLSGLDSLTEIGGDLDIQSNGSLRSLSGLGSLTEIGGYLFINNNALLMSLSGLSSLTEIAEYMYINNNASLASLSGLASLTDVGGHLNIYSNNSLTSLSGLDSLTEIGGNVFIYSNNSLRSLSGLEMLDSIGGSLTLTSNPALTDFCTISSLIGDDKQITSGEYTVNTNSYNPPYTFVGNENFCSNADGGIFEGNLRLTSQDSIDAFNYSGVTGNLTINDAVMNNITNLSGLNELIQVGGILQIDNNSSLTSLSGLESLTEIGGYLTINDNDSLESLSGLETLHSTGDMLIVTGNRDLTDFCAISPLIGNVNQITRIAYIVSGNDYNPLYTEIQTTTHCSLDPPVVVADLPDVFIQSGDVFDPINLASAFSDPNRYALTYPANSSDTAVVTVSISDSTLTLTEVGVGIATITVTATNDSVLSVSTAFTVFITPNLPPTVENPLIDIETVSGTALETRDLSAVFRDPEGEALTYTLATSDTAIVTAALNDTILTLTETGKGTATITVTATDAFGLPFDATFEVTITNTTPEVLPNQLVTVFTQLGTAFAPIDLSAAFRDANGDELTYTVTSSDENVVTVSVSGDTLTLTEVGVGTATITVTATDGDASVSATFIVSITQNMPPTVENTLMDVETVSGTAFETMDLSAVFRDPEGEALTYTVATSNLAIVTVALNGTTLTLTETGKGTATITVTATDAFGLPFDATFEATIMNTAPVVANQLVTVFTQLGTAFAPIDLSAAFRDANGDELTYTVTSSDENVVTVSVSGDTLTLTEVGVGTATITVTATDGDAPISSMFMATINQNNAPIRTLITFPPIPIVEVGYELEQAVNLTPFFSDPDGDALTYTATTEDTSIITVEIVQTSRVTFTAIGAGTTTITITATDPDGLPVSESVMLTVEEKEDPPPLGIADTDILAIYPNPSSGVFQLSRRATTVRVYDMSGRLVYQGRKIKQLDLTTHPAGQYLVEVRIGKERGRYTVIKQ